MVKKILILLVLGVLAVATQALAVFKLLNPEGPLDPLAVFFLWQALAAVFCALFVTVMLPPHYLPPRRGAFFHIFVICLFLPVAGSVLFMCVTIVAVIFPTPLDNVNVSSVENPEFVTYLISRVTHGTGARLRARLENLRSSPQDRVAALVAMQSLPSHVTGTMLRDLLSDPIEEIRLLAYGIVDGTEKAIMQRIFVAREQLANATESDTEANACARLAELYWELIYQNLVRGEVYRYSLGQVERYARQALAQNQENASMYYLLGRCASLNDAPQHAEEFFKRAQELHFPTDRLLPWLAEMAFLKRDYSRVGPLLGSLSKGSMVPLLQPLMRYWSK